MGCLTKIKGPYSAICDLQVTSEWFLMKLESNKERKDFPLLNHPSLSQLISHKVKTIIKSLAMFYIYCTLYLVHITEGSLIAKVRKKIFVKETLIILHLRSCSSNDSTVGY